MTVLPEKGWTAPYEGKTVYFCSEYCREKFLREPERYSASLVVPSYEEANENKRFAYFSMEVAIDPKICTYSGGLGVLAGDHLKSCADLEVPAVGLTLLSRKGYFEQKLDEWGGQHESPASWSPEEFLRPLPEVGQVEIEGRPVDLRAWQYDIVGATGYVVPLVFLDTGLERNTAYDRTLTDHLYGGDERYQLAQEIVLGVGGVRMLRALGYHGIQKYHMNEGHASLLVLELLSDLNPGEAKDWDFEGVRRRCAFTTHTPVPAGHDQFSYGLVQNVLTYRVSLEVLQMLAGRDRLNMTLLGLNPSRFVNGVAMRHEEVSLEMFPGYPIHHVTNGVHSWTWTAEEFKTLYDRYIPGWSKDPAMMRKAVSIPGPS